MNNSKGNLYKINYKNMVLYRLLLAFIFIIIISILFAYILDYYNYDFLIIKRVMPNIYEDISSEPYIYPSDVYYAKMNSSCNHLTSRNCVFSPFIDLFTKNGTTSCNYFPSYFLPTSFDTQVIDRNSLIVYNIVRDQHNILYENADNLHKLLVDLAHILADYKQVFKVIAI